MIKKEKELIRKILAGTFALLMSVSASVAQPQTVSNNVVSLTISGQRGGSIDSFKILGTETLDVADLGREIQASIFLNANELPAMTNTCRNPTPPWLNPQDAGSECGVPSQIYALGKTGNRVDVGTRPQEWHGRGQIQGFRIEGHHTVGPLSYLNAQEAIQLKYQFYWDSVYPNQSKLNFRKTVGNTPVQFVPAAYFKSNVLSRVFGLEINGTNWVEVTSNVNVSQGDYTPSLYRFRAMAWVRQDLSYGIALYSRSTLNQNCPVSYTMEIVSQQGQCPNFAAQSFPNQLTNNLSVVDQSLPSLFPGQGVERISHMFVGNLGTLQHLVNTTFNSGN